MENKIEIIVDYENHVVDRSAYIKAKTKQLKQFGYTDLTEKEVEEQLEKIFKKKKLNIIGMFMEKEIVLKAK